MSVFILPDPTTLPSGANPKFNLAIASLPANSTWIINHQYDNNGADINLLTLSQANVVLQFEGGSITNFASFLGNNTHIDCPYEVECFSKIGSGGFVGTWKNSTVSPVWFEAKPNGLTDATLAFNLAITFLNRTSPPGFPGYGQGTVFVPKGIFLVNGTIGSSTANSIGLNFEGAGQFATSIITNVDNVSMFSFQLNVSLKFSDISFIHVTSTSGSSWTNALFTLSGVNGGRNLRLERITTQKFGWIIKQTGSTNSDTNVVEHCTFYDCNIFLESENPQAILNEFNNCTWGGAISKAFFIAGFSKTYIKTGNIVMDGTFLEFKDTAGKYGPGAHYTMENCKLEWQPINNDPEVTAPPKLFLATGNNVSGTLTIIGGGLTGGSHLPNSRLFSYGCPMRVVFQGGSYEGVPELVAKSSYLRHRNIGLIMENTDIIAPKVLSTNEIGEQSWIWNWILSPLPGSWPIDGRVFPNVSLDNCYQVTGPPQDQMRLTDINLSWNKGQPELKPNRIMSFGPDNARGEIVTAPGTDTYSLPFYNQQVLINSVKFVLYAKYTAGTAATINIYSNFTKNPASLIGTAEIPAAAYPNSNNNKVIEIPITQTVTTDGIYCEILKTDSAITRGNFIADYTSI
ncbi:MAG: hypothetical protein PSV16_08030 [Flavobacterium sp.]|nr:hypothetical protein [Flavobacterium sp.]